MPVTLNPETWINWPLIKEPLNWAIVAVVASIWLLAFHSIMTGFRAMQSTTQGAFSTAPGMIAAPLPSTVIRFATPGDTGAAGGFSNSWFGIDTTWTDGFESKYAEDGWTGDFP